MERASDWLFVERIRWSVIQRSLFSYNKDNLTTSGRKQFGEKHENGSGRWGSV